MFENVSLAFDDKVILDGISFSLLPGNMKIVLGASGAGKSTILRLALGLLKPDAGRIFVNGERIDDMTEDQLMAVLWAVGEFAFRSTPILASLRRHRDESPPISGVPRALLALHLLDQMVIRGAISLDDVRKQMRIEDEKCRQGENGQS